MGYCTLGEAPGTTTAVDPLRDYFAETYRLRDEMVADEIRRREQQQVLLLQPRPAPGEDSRSFGKLCGDPLIEHLRH